MPSWWYSFIVLRLLPSFLTRSDPITAREQQLFSAQLATQKCVKPLTASWFLGKHSARRTFESLVPVCPAFRGTASTDSASAEATPLTRCTTRCVSPSFRCPASVFAAELSVIHPSQLCLVLWQITRCAFLRSWLVKH